MNSVTGSNSKLHQKKLQNLIKEQKNEIEKLKINHQKNKNSVSNENARDITSLQSRNQQDRLDKIKNQEEILSKLQENLDKVKNNTDSRLDQVQTNHAKKIEDENKVFEQEIRNLKAKNALRVQEATQISNADLRRIRRNYEQEKADLKRNSSEDISQTKTSSNAKKRLEADEYRRLESKETNKFTKALRKQKVQNKSIISDNKEKLIDTVNKQEETAKNDINRIKLENNQKKISEMKTFEKNYKTLLEKNNGDLQRMVKKKDDVIQNLQREILGQKEIALTQKDDKFYSMGTLKVSVSQLSDNKGYEVKIPVNELEANNIDFKAEKRELRLSMERAHKSHVVEEGRFDSVSKIETYMSKIPVEEIINPKTIEKSYSDGVLTFKVGLA